MAQKTAYIIGAGPAGLTAAWELLCRTDIKPVIVEQTEAIGGLSQTVNYRGNRIDIGGHRFFSKSDRVMDAWRKVLPQEDMPAMDPTASEKVMLIRHRLSRILFLRRFFNYPLSLSLDTLKHLGLLRTWKIGIGYVKTQIRPVKPERTLEDFFINRFGRELYHTFFEDYTQKVWGVPCNAIPRDWGAQRVKGLSIAKAVYHAVKKFYNCPSSLAQKKTETSLIEQFLYPKYGPGQLWEELARKIRQNGGEIWLRHTVCQVECRFGNVAGITVRNEVTGETTVQKPDYLLSSMPVKDLVESLRGDTVPAAVQEVAAGLLYRDFITVGILLDREQYPLLPDNWIYVQERDVKVGRIQVFNNWSPYLVKERGHVWLGLEYFCRQGDELWNTTDGGLKNLAAGELAALGLIHSSQDVLDSTVIRMPKAYPAYFGSYHQFGTVRGYLDSISNLFLIGRNGMHRYNNMDHSMLTAMAAVDNIANGDRKKDNIWSVNAEEEYHEQK